ncbi:MAG: sigma-54-dependent Fis family transcriptional regulator [Gemmatimonadaceae bacterium]|nr:sigma-54-dependent Fis family transcriptional regulator [Gemmatimonadaceae bacterium]
MKVLITLNDLEPAARLNGMLERAGFEPALVPPVDDLPTAIAREKPDLIVMTGGLVDLTNVRIARQQLWDGCPVVGLADLDDPAVHERLRAVGFLDVFTKPVDVDEVFDAIKRILERRRLQQATGLIGESPAMREVMVKIEQMAPVSSTVLIEGESGTGKELVARAIHQLSGRRGGPFIAVNVGALPETLLESELFGHEKGAFTGAAERRLGRFELADGGTLFLDEIGEIPQSTQVKLLRVLEEREVTRVGGSAAIDIDVRVVAATNRALREHVIEGGFRADLYYRLNVLNIYLPPLRERREDIPILVRRFVTEFSRRHDKPFHGISADAMQVLGDYPWPGNVRELRNLIESMVVLAPPRELRVEDLPRELREGGRLLPVHVAHAPRAGEHPAGGNELEFILRSLVELKLQVEEMRRRMDEGSGVRGRGPGDAWIGEGVVQGGGARPLRAVGEVVRGIEPPEEVPTNVVTIEPGTTMAEIERRAIAAALRETRGNRRKAAEMLGIGERTLYRKLKELPGGELLAGGG